MKLTPTFTLFAGSIFTLLVWIAAKTNCLYGINVQDLAPLFTGLGFVGLITAFKHQQDVATGAQNEHQDVLTQMRLHGEEAARQNRVVALATLFQCYSAQLRELTKSPINQDAKAISGVKEQIRGIQNKLEETANQAANI